MNNKSIKGQIVYIVVIDVNNSGNVINLITNAYSNENDAKRELKELVSQPWVQKCYNKWKEDNTRHGLWQDNDLCYHYFDMEDYEFNHIYFGIEEREIK